MVGPVHHISRRDHINGINISIGIVHGTIVLRFIFLRVICHIDINSSIIFHRIWIRAKLMVYQRIGIARLLCQRSHIYVFQCYDRFRTADIIGHLVSCGLDIICLYGSIYVCRHIICGFQFNCCKYIVFFCRCVTNALSIYRQKKLSVTVRISCRTCHILFIEDYIRNL